jgi:hypothetical protein
MDGRTNYAWMAFVAMAVGIVGLVGVFATYAAPLPLERALARDAALDEALAATGRPDEAARLQALRPRLGDSADPIEQGSGPLAERIERERAAMRERFANEAQAVASRLRLMIVVVTVMGAGFAAAVAGGIGRRDKG